MGKSIGGKKNLAEEYRKKILKRKSMAGTGGNESLESATETTLPADTPEVNADTSRKELHRLIDTYLDGNENLKQLADKAATDGREALKAVCDDNPGYLEKNPQKLGALEVIVRTDGSRPSFMIRNGTIDYQSSPAGSWSDILPAEESSIRNAISCVGRVNNKNGAHIGTGFLVANNMVITNRHVLQEIATKENDNTWKMLPGTFIDFGHEFRAQTSLWPRNINRVVFCPPQYIDPRNIDHSKLDLVVLECDPVDTQTLPIKLSIGGSSEWAQPGNFIYIVGYPGNPGLAGLQQYSTLLEQLFKSTFGCKRLAPGEIILPTADTGTLSFAHDATTLGGNSGSVILAQAKGVMAAGLHYGGNIQAPRENWGHVLGNTLNAANSIRNQTLKQCLEENNIAIVDMFAQ